MDPVKMKSLDYARKLRARKAELEAKFAADVKAFPKLCQQWRVAIRKWLLTEAPKLTDAIPDKQIRGRSKYDDFKMPAGAPPSPPRYPNRERIQRVTMALRHLAVTGQTHIHVGQNEIEKLFLDGASDDD